VCYGWTDINPRTTSIRTTGQTRFTISPSTAEVLARLLDLNQQIAARTAEPKS